MSGMQHAAHAAMPGMAEMHGMTALPLPLLLAALTAACALFVWVLVRGPRRLAATGPSWRIELSSLPPLRWLLSRRPFQFTLQVPLVLTLFLILTAGFYGTPVAERNFATVATWTIWWTLLIVDIVLLGRMWCLVCPWDALASWIRRLAFWRRRDDEPLALELPWPRWLKNVYPATLLFVGLTWLELGFGVTRRPRATAILGLVMILLAVLPALVFERRSFCRYGCLVGRICGLYSMLAPVEVRARSLDVCRTCTTKDCLHGNERGYPCPTGQVLAGMQTNTYCTVCTECFKSCRKTNVALNVRPWGSDLETLRKPRRDEAILALVLLSLTSFHGLTMTPTWTDALARLRSITGLGYLAAFSLGMTVVLLLPAATYLTSTLTAALGRRAAFVPMALQYAYPLIAVALMYHLAHNAGHFLLEAGVFVPVLSDPLGNGADLLGTAHLAPGPLAPTWLVRSLQIALVLLGLAWALRATERAHRRLQASGVLPRIGLRQRIAPAAFVLLVSALNLWLLAQPMEMRTGL